MLQWTFFFSDPYTQYDVRVRAVTGGGKGQFSDRYPAMTDVTGKVKGQVQFINSEITTILSMSFIWITKCIEYFSFLSISYCESNETFP